MKIYKLHKSSKEVASSRLIQIIHKNYEALDYFSSSYNNLDVLQQYSNTATILEFYNNFQATGRVFRFCKSFRGLRQFSCCATIFELCKNFSRRPEADHTLNDLSVVFQSPSSVKHCKVGTMRGGRDSRLQEPLGIMVWASRCHTLMPCVFWCMAPAGFASGRGGGGGVSCGWTNNQKVKCVVLRNLPKALKQLKNICN